MIERAKKSGSFCIYPFTHLATKTEGTFKLCCRSEPIAHVDSSSALETWNGEIYRRVRRQMLNGERPPECDDCWRLEDVGTRSMRQRAGNPSFRDSRWNRHSHVLQSCAEDGTMSITPKTLEMKVSNVCNLKCRMCSPIDSTSWASEWPEVEDLHKVHNTWAYETAREYGLSQKPKLAGFEDNAKWWSEFDEMIEHLELVEFAGGEPLIDPIHYRILKLMARRGGHIRLKYSTNLTKLSCQGTQVFDLWKQFAGVSVYASVDGVGAVYDYIRTGTTFSKIERNLKLLQAEKSIPLDELAIACTIQVYNCFQLPEIATYFQALGVKLHTHRVTFPTFLSAQILPLDIKARLTAEIARYMQRTPNGKYEEQMFAPINKHFEDHLNFMNGRDESALLPVFKDFTDRTDRLRGTDVRTLHPWLAEVMDRIPVLPRPALSETVTFNSLS